MRACLLSANQELIMGIFDPKQKISLTKNYDLAGLIKGLSQVESNLFSSDVKERLREGGHPHTELTNDVLTYNEEGRLRPDELLLACRANKDEAPFLIWSALLLADERLRNAVCSFLVNQDGSLCLAHFNTAPLQDWVLKNANASTPASARKTATNILGLFDQLGFVVPKKRGAHTILVDPTHRKAHVPSLLRYLQDRLALAGQSSSLPTVIHLAADLRMHQWLLLSPTDFAEAATAIVGQPAVKVICDYQDFLEQEPALLKLEQRVPTVHAPLIDRERDLRQKISAVAKRLGVREEAAFSIWYCQYYLGIPEEQAIQCVNDGSRDRGLDFFYRDNLRRQVHLGQAAYVTSSKNSPSKEKLTHTLKHLEAELTEPQKLRQQGLPKIANFAEEYKAALMDNYEVVLHFIFPGYAAPDLKRIAAEFDEEQRNEATNRSLAFASLDELIDLMLTVESGTDKWAPPDQIQLRHDGYFIQAGLAGHQALVTSLSGAQIKEWVQTYEDAVFGQNIRFFQKKTNVNKNLALTLEDTQEQGKFWAYNNGITILTKRFELDPDKHVLHLGDFSIINGCQTASTIHAASREAASAVSVPVRIISLEGGESGEDFLSNVILYNNSQNTVRSTALASKDKQQQELRQHLMKWPEPWFYELRVGDFNNLNSTVKSSYERARDNGHKKTYRHIHSPEAAQRLAAWRGLVKSSYSDKAGMFSEPLKEQIFPPATPPKDLARELVWAWECGEAAQRVSKELRSKSKKADSKEAEVVRKTVLVQKMTLAVMHKMLEIDGGERLFESPFYLERLGTSVIEEMLDWYAAKAAEFSILEMVQYLDRNELDVLSGIRKDSTHVAVLDKSLEAYGRAKSVENGIVPPKLF